MIDKYKISADEFAKVSFERMATRPNTATSRGESGMGPEALKKRFDAPARLLRDKFNALIALIAGEGGKESLLDYLQTGIDKGKSLREVLADITAENGAFASYLSVGDMTLAKKLAQLEDMMKEGGVGESTNELGGEIFNTYEDDDAGEYVRVRNIALSVAATAHGNGTVAGCMAFRLLGSRDIETDDGVVGVYLLDSVGGIEIGDEFSIKYKSNYDCCGKVIAIGPADASSLGYVLGENEIAVEGNVINDPAYDPEEHDAPVLWFYHKPTIGTTPWGTGQHASGDNNKAVGPQSSSEGRNNVSAGRYAHTEGKDNFAVYAAHAQGRGTKAMNECSDTAGFGTEASGYASHAGGNRTRAEGNQSHTGGTKTVARGENAFAHGSSCEADGVNSAAFGQGTKATKKNQFVGGAYNEVRDDAVAIFGNGSADQPSNAMVVLEDGSVEVGKQGTSGNAVVLKSTLDAVVKQGCIQDEVTANNVAVISPDMVGGCTVTALNTGVIRKFGINLIGTNKTYNNFGIVSSVDAEKSGIIVNGECTATTWAMRAGVYAAYYPAGHYTFFIEGLDTKHAPDMVYIELRGTNAVTTTDSLLATVNSANPVAEFDVSEDGVSTYKIDIRIKAGESFTDEHIKFQLQAGVKTEFTPYKSPRTIELVAGEETTIAVDDLSPFTLVSQTEGNTITCAYPIRIKSYIDRKIEGLR